jgi:hydrogenase maturation protease
MPDIAILGLGNVLIGDDAFGPHVVRRFDAEYEVDPQVEVLDFGTPGFDLAPFLMDAQRVIIVDTVKAEAAPGTICHYDKADILRRPLTRARVNPHDPGLKDTLLLLDLQGAAPAEVHFIGVVPASVKTGIAISDAVRAAVPGAIAAVVESLARMGHPPRRRAVPADPGLWWERTAVVSAEC